MGVSILPEATLNSMIDGCIRQDRDSQKRFYKYFYGFAYTICQRYISIHEDTIEVLNDGFLKIYNELYRFEKRQDSLESSLKAWMRRVMVNTSIDRLRKFKQKKNLLHGPDSELQNLSTPELALHNLSYQDVLNCIEKLTPAYRTVFNLFVIDGYSHEEIAGILNISIGSSKSNLAKARVNLQRLLSSDLHYNHYEPKAI